MWRRVLCSRIKKGKIENKLFKIQTQNVIKKRKHKKHMQNYEMEKTDVYTFQRHYEI